MRVKAFCNPWPCLHGAQLCAGCWHLLFTFHWHELQAFIRAPISIETIFRIVGMTTIGATLTPVLTNMLFMSGRKRYTKIDNYTRILPQ